MLGGSPRRHSPTIHTGGVSWLEMARRPVEGAQLPLVRVVDEGVQQVALRCLRQVAADVRPEAPPGGVLQNQVDGRVGLVVSVQLDHERDRGRHQRGAAHLLTGPLVNDLYTHDTLRSCSHHTDDTLRPCSHHSDDTLRPCSHHRLVCLWTTCTQTTHSGHVHTTQTTHSGRVHTTDWSACERPVHRRHT